MVTEEEKTDFIDIAPPQLTWRACYSDGTVIEEHSEDGHKNIIADLDTEFLTRIMVYDAGKFLRPVVIPFNPESTPRKQPIFYRETIVKNGGGSMTAVAVGWKKKIGGISVKSITLIFPDGTVENFDEEATCFYDAIQILDKQ